jgi:hypothetical protein
MASAGGGPEVNADVRGWDVQAAWVIKIVIMPSRGSERQMVPKPPSQPYAPAGAAG